MGDKQGDVVGVEKKEKQIRGSGGEEEIAGKGGG